MMKHSYVQSDGDKGEIRMILWNHPGDDYTGIMARCERVVDTCEKVRRYYYCMLEMMDKKNDV